MADKKKVLEFIKKIYELEDKYGLEVVSDIPNAGVYIYDSKEDKHYDFEDGKET